MTCPFCGSDPFHYENFGMGGLGVPVAVVCCELGVEWFDRRSDKDVVTVGWDDFERIARAFEALRMVRDADDDCHSDGLQTIPPVARSAIDRALSTYTPERIKAIDPVHQRLPREREEQRMSDSVQNPHRTQSGAEIDGRCSPVRQLDAIGSAGVVCSLRSGHWRVRASVLLDPGVAAAVHVAWEALT